MENLNYRKKPLRSITKDGFFNDTYISSGINNQHNFLPLSTSGNRGQAGIIANSLNTNFSKSNEEMAKMNNNVNSLINLLAEKYKNENKKKE